MVGGIKGYKSMLDNDHGDDEDDEDDGERLTRYEALRERVEEAGDAIAAAARLAMVVLRGSMWQPLVRAKNEFRCLAWWCENNKQFHEVESTFSVFQRLCVPYLLYSVHDDHFPRLTTYELTNPQRAVERVSAWNHSAHGRNILDSSMDADVWIFIRLS